MGSRAARKRAAGTARPAAPLRPAAPASHNGVRCSENHLAQQASVVHYDTMSAEIATGLFTLAGTLIGSGLTFAANRSTSRAQRDIASAAQVERMTAARASVYTDFYISVNALRDRCRELCAVLENKAPVAECARVQEAHQLAWTDFIKKHPPVLIAGPVKVADEARKVKVQLAELSQLCDDWYQAYVDGTTRTRSTKFATAADAAENALNEFIDEAQAVSSPEDRINENKQVASGRQSKTRGSAPDPGTASEIKG